jgi:hypothetical protein
VGRQARRIIQNKVGKKWKQIQEECSWEERKKWNRLCQKISHHNGNTIGYW